ncbi:MAG: aldo/keto reductase [Bdellovibrionales bacterium]|jgi:aryl-alcohol dehydrogenase-like predicted oxidoreductase|nr:aldo/keto reductase [Bdellovibrionales bacterium]
MEYKQIYGIKKRVSAICLGTMTFGEQNSIKESHEIMDYAYSQGVNFFDTAEMYPIPPSGQTYNQTESIIGKWNKIKTNRDKIIIASKVIGPSREMSYIRDGDHKLNKKNMTQALNGSLKRLNTDYIDLYQIHWPERTTNFFGRLGFEKNEDIEINSIAETLEVLHSFIQEGKIKAIGISNETPWGLMQYLKWSDKLNLTKISTIQNPYNLLNRTFEVGLSEMSMRENVGLLAYSPLGFGTLSGKYIENKSSPSSRLNKWPSYLRYSSPQSIKAIEKYLEISKRFNISLTQLALSFVNNRDFISSTIIGATNLKQLEENIESINLALPDEIIFEINKIHKEISNPAP